MLSINNKDDLVDYVVNNGIDYTNELGEGILHQLVMNDDKVLVVYLLSSEKIKERFGKLYNVNLLDNYGRTALYYVKSREMAELLIRFRIDYKVLDKYDLRADEYNEHVDYVLNKKCMEMKFKWLRS